MVTTHLRRWSRGEPHAAEAVLQATYDELRGVAARNFALGNAPTLQPTLLAHEAFLRLAERGNVDWKDRQHYYGVAVRAMRQVVAEHLRHKERQKRGGRWQRLGMTEVERLRPVEHTAGQAVLEAVERLAKRAPDLAHLVELRFQYGYSIEETAEMLGISTASVGRRWRRARAWLRVFLGDDEPRPLD